MSNEWTPEREEVAEDRWSHRRILYRPDTSDPSCHRHNLACWTGENEAGPIGNMASRRQAEELVQTAEDLHDLTAYTRELRRALAEVVGDDHELLTDWSAEGGEW